MAIYWRHPSRPLPFKPLWEESGRKSREVIRLSGELFWTSYGQMFVWLGVKSGHKTKCYFILNVSYDESFDESFDMTTAISGALKITRFCQVAIFFTERDPI